LVSIFAYVLNELEWRAKRCVEIQEAGREHSEHELASPHVFRHAIFNTGVGVVYTFQDFITSCYSDMLFTVNPR